MWLPQRLCLVFSASVSFYQRIWRYINFYLYLYLYWATVCKTVRPMLLDRRPVLSCPSVLSVTLVYCGQTVARIKMKLGTLVGLGPGHIVLDGTQLPSPISSLYPLSQNGWTDQDATW